MKKRKFIIDRAEREKFLEVFTLLDYSVESETPRGNDIIFIIKKEEEDFTTSVVEHELIPNIPPLWWLFIPAALVIIIMTVYLIVQLGHLWTADKFLKFLVFFIPSAVLLAVDAVIYFVRGRAITKIAKNQPSLINEIKNRLNK